MKKSEPHTGPIMSIYSECRCFGSQIFEDLGLKTSTGVQPSQPFNDGSLEIQPPELLCLKHQSLEPQFLEDQSRDTQSFRGNSLEPQFLEDQFLKVQSLKNPTPDDNSLDFQIDEDHSFEDQTIGIPYSEDFGIPSSEISCVDNLGQLFQYMERPQADVDHVDFRRPEKSANKFQGLLNFYDQKYPSDTFKPQAVRPKEDKPINKMRHSFFTKFPLVVILAIGYLTIFNIFVMLHPDSYREQTSEGGIRLVVHPLFVSMSKPTQIKYPGFRPPILEDRIGPSHGGIYFDVDQIALKSFDRFRHHQMVMAHESKDNLGNAVIISKKMAPFLDVWFRNYNSYDPKRWGYHSTYLPLELSKRYPDLIHIENRTFFDLDLSRIYELYYGHVEWSESTAVHLYVRWIKKYFTLNELRTMDTSIGEIARFIMYDSTKICQG
ncbi:hypothetical protein LOTGIDRAFT_163922 [Lottia gigantea]|uniref:Uncharacterized protein n=1 Tax=Lottia gigantea TaxID=225164 RepID=V4BP28_LOTGI|nr:hypothetical protein LOTGIDRAFT_163922 [Lottia gigantea]ESO90684.1 hypothetical protein LOTGIDRAFT_163922 [Lottia gigantea]